MYSLSAHSPFSCGVIGATVTEIAGSHAVYVSQPNPVAALIEKAARELK
jgi:hypothetical protein